MRSLPARLLATLCLGSLVLTGCSGVVSHENDSSGAPTSTSSASASPDADPSDEPSTEPSTEPGEPGASEPSDPSAEPVAYDDLTPSPEDAVDDLPDLYGDDCQLGFDDATPTNCAYGADRAEATATVAVVGDSKSGQWTPALQQLAEARGWRVEIYTKSACAAVDVPMSRGGEDYATCTAFNRAVDARLLADPVDLVVTSSGSSNALVTRPLRRGEDQANASLRTFVSSERRTWTRWIRAGMRVAVISDNPKPVADGDNYDVATCLEDNLAAGEDPDDLAACSFDRAEGIAASGREGQKFGIRNFGAVDVSQALRGRNVPRAASAELAWIDPVPFVCPQSRCQPNDGEILVYREGSHLTRTYVESLTRRFDVVMTVLGLP